MRREEMRVPTFGTVPQGAGDTSNRPKLSHKRWKVLRLLIEEYAIDSHQDRAY